MLQVIQNIRFNFFILSFFIVAASFSQIKKMSPPRWKKGYLDFHQISTGMGNSCFIQFPDGSNLLIDAGAINRDYNRKYPPYPLFDSTQTAGSYIAAYIKKCIPNKLPVQLDNVILTHFHDDHVGFPDSQSLWSESGLYKLSGITEIAALIPVKLILDNKFPVYNETNPVTVDIIRNYQLFIAEQRENKEFRIDSFLLGSLNGILNFRTERKKLGFEVIGQAVRGKYLKTNGHIEAYLKNDSTINPIVAENNLSCALTIRYGKFSFFTGGDIDNNATYTGKFVGYADEISKNTGKITFWVAGHHGMQGSINEKMIEANNPDYLIIPAWSYGHPDIEILKYLLENHPDLKIISTQLHPLSLKDLEKVGLGGTVNSRGHIMIRIKRNGKTARLYFVKP